MQFVPSALALVLPPWARAVVETYHGLFVQFGTFVVVLVALYLLGRLFVVPPLVRIVRFRNPQDRTLVDAVRLYGRILLFVFSFAVATAAAGFQRAFQGSAIVVAAATLALGVAGQDVIGNLVSGAFLVADPDFNVGDYIEWGDRAGTVEAVEFRVTRVRTVEGASVSVPNGELTSHPIRNPYGNDQYRMQVAFGVRHDDVEEAADLARAAALATDRVLEEPTPTVYADAFGSTSVDLIARFWVRDPKRARLLTVRDAFVRRLNDRLREAGVGVNPPIQNELSGAITVEDAAGTRAREDATDDH